MSSRNRRLHKTDRAHASQLCAALTLAKHAIAEGKTPVQAEQVAREYLLSQPGIMLDYFTILNEQLMQPKLGEPLRALVAANVGGVRLIDNMPVGNMALNKPLEG